MVDFLISRDSFILVFAILLLLIPAVLVFGFLRYRNINRILMEIEGGRIDETLKKKIIFQPGLLKIVLKRLQHGKYTQQLLAEYLTISLSRYYRVKDACKLLELPGFIGVHAVFMTALKKKHIARIFNRWLSENRNLTVLRQLALECGNCPFDVSRASALLGDVLEQYKGIFSDPEWKIRLFALKLLLFDPKHQSASIIEEAFFDSHYQVRLAAIEQVSSDFPKLFERLKALVHDDPIGEVRNAARSRIDREFARQWIIKPDELNSLQIIHVLEQLRIDSREDHNTAVFALQSDNIEARLVAARFLEKSGYLDDMLRESRLGDMDDWERKYNILNLAISVGIRNFLKILHSVQSLDLLYMCARLLESGCDKELIYSLANNVFVMWKEKDKNSALRELYQSTVRLICLFPSEKTVSLLRDELRNNRTDKFILDMVLPILPEDRAYIYSSVLIDLLDDPELESEDALLEIMAKVPSAMFLEKVLSILESDRVEYPYAIRLRALRILGSWCLDYTLQYIVENLYLLPDHLYKDFIGYFSRLNSRDLKERTQFILETRDADIKAGLISCLPDSIVKHFSPQLIEGLGDPNHQVRIACFRALITVKDLLTEDKLLGIIRDPVETVRLTTVRIAGECSSRNVLLAMEKILFDTDETLAVRMAAMEGLTVSTDKISVDILVKFLDIGQDLRQEILGHMSRKTDKICLAALIEHFKNAKSLLRERIVAVFVTMGLEVGYELIPLLDDKDSSLKPYLSDVFVGTGLVEVLVGKIRSKVPQNRRDAVEKLYSIGTVVAYRGIVMGVQDPDEQVRFMVTKALQSLVEPESQQILDSLLNDPDKKVRMYTQWALDRLKAKNNP